MTSIVFLGECMIEENDRTDFSFGGDTLNTAIYLSRTINHNISSIHYATALGIDYKSDLMIDAWNAESINTDYVVRLNTKTPGSYKIFNDKTGERSFLYNRKDSAARYYFSLGKTPLEHCLKHNLCDIFFFSGISMAILPPNDRIKLLTLIEEYSAKGGIVVFDCNFRQSLWKDDPIRFFSRALNIANMIFLTPEDEYVLYGDNNINDIFKRIDGFNISEVILKQGSKPCIIKHNNEYTKVAGINIDKVVDTCAAGDAFAAGYLAKRLFGSSIFEAAKFAHKIASKVIQFEGAIVPKQVIPTD